MDQDFINSIKPEMMPALRASFLLVYLIYIVIYSFYISNLYKLLSLINPANRRIQPSKVLLLAVGFLNIVTAAPLFIKADIAARYEHIILGIDIAIMVFMLMFTFYMVNKIAESLDAELKSRNINNDPKPTWNLGIFMCTCSAAALLKGVAYLDVFGSIAAMAALVAWILYWIKTKEYRTRLESMPPTTNLNDLGIF